MSGVLDSCLRLWPFVLQLGGSAHPRDARLGPSSPSRSALCAAPSLICTVHDPGFKRPIFTSHAARGYQAGGRGGWPRCALTTSRRGIGCRSSVYAASTDVIKSVGPRCGTRTKTPNCHLPVSGERESRRKREIHPRFHAQGGRGRSAPAAHVRGLPFRICRDRCPIGRKL
jgi:hypothetical protein